MDFLAVSKKLVLVFGSGILKGCSYYNFTLQKFQEWSLVCLSGNAKGKVTYLEISGGFGKKRRVFWNREQEE